MGTTIRRVEPSHNFSFWGEGGMRPRRVLALPPPPSGVSTCVFALCTPM